ncbi:hypothetical protein [Streptomyces clavifer]|uniref:hypothetical protein n=1 Tax=Streptomyces clavifer TaxID=68188 RepID=UPI00365E2BA8
MKAGFGSHGTAVTAAILAFGGRDHLTDWQVEVSHAIKVTGFNIDAVLAWPTKTSEMRFSVADHPLTGAPQVTCPPGDTGHGRGRSRDGESHSALYPPPAVRPGD